MSDARVRHFMSAEVATVPCSASLAEVVGRMRGARVSCVVVVDGRRPVGVVTERDLTGLCARLLEGESAGSVAELMSDGVITLAADASCGEAVELIQRRRIRRLVVVDARGDLCGIITQTDLLRAHTHEIEMQKGRLEERVAERTRELEQLNVRLETLARIDPMLGIGNRRAMDDELSKIAERAQRYGRPYSLALVDVDHFKRFNDRYGHQDGDVALSAVARTIGSAVRAADSVYRYGGEEFLVLFPEVAADGAVIASEHIRRAVEALALIHECSPHGQVTVSVGVADDEPRRANANLTISAADKALYRAKHLGRNRVELASAADARDDGEDEEPARCPKVA